MAQSLANLLVHLIFSTKERQPFLQDKGQRAAMHRYLGAVSGGRRCRNHATPPAAPAIPAQ